MIPTKALWPGMETAAKHRKWLQLNRTAPTFDWHRNIYYYYGMDKMQFYLHPPHPPRHVCHFVDLLHRPVGSDWAHELAFVKYAIAQYTNEMWRQRVRNIMNYEMCNHCNNYKRSILNMRGSAHIKCHACSCLSLFFCCCAMRGFHFSNTHDLQIRFDGHFSGQPLYPCPIRWTGDKQLN